MGSADSVIFETFTQKFPAKHHAEILQPGIRVLQGGGIIADL